MHDTDTELVAAALRGEQAGIAGIYDRYADRLQNYAWSVCRSHADASDIVQDTFVTASVRLSQLRDPERLRPWLYAIARHQALRVIRERKRVEVSSEIDMTTDFPQPASGLDAQQLVWDAAAGLDPKDRDILSLHLREGLDGEDLAAALGVKPNAANVALFRVRERLEHAVGAVLLARFARGGCDELDTMMADQLTPLIRKRAARHIEKCDDCQEGRRRIGSPAALFAATPAALAPAALRETVLSSWGTAPSPAAEIPAWRKDGFPDGTAVHPTAGPQTRSAAGRSTAGRSTADASVRRARFAAAGGIAVVAIGVAFFALLRPAPDTIDQLASSDAPAALDATTIAPPLGSAAAPAPAELPTTTGAVRANEPAPPPPTQPNLPTADAPPTTPQSTSPTTPPATAPPTTVAPPTTEPGSPSPFPPIAQPPADQPEVAVADSVSLSVLEFECAAVITVRLLVSGTSDPTVTIRYERNVFVLDVELTESATEPNIYEGELEVREGQHRITARARVGSASDSELLAESCGQIG